MAQIANTFTTTDAVGNREELSDVINMITPQKTPIYSMIGVGTCKTTHPEWEIDELAAPSDNAQLEGDEFTFGPVTPPARVGNYTQIFRNSFIMSDTQARVNNAGEQERFKKQRLKKGIELRRDVEYAIIQNTASVGGELRKLGGLPSWIETNVDRGDTGANGGYNPNDGLTDQATAGTKRAFSLDQINNVMAQGFSAGAEFNMAFVAPYVKTVFSSFINAENTAQFSYESRRGQKNAIVATASVYEGDFGSIMFVPHYMMSASADIASNIFLLDTSMLEFLWLEGRKIKDIKDLAKTGDSRKCVMLGEGTLKVANEAGLAVVADLFGLDATT